MLSRAGYPAELNRYFIRAKTSRNPDARIKNWKSKYFPCRYLRRFVNRWKEGEREFFAVKRADSKQMCFSVKRGTSWHAQRGVLSPRVWRNTADNAKMERAISREERVKNMQISDATYERKKEFLVAEFFLSNALSERPKIYSVAHSSFFYYVSFHFSSPKRRALLCRGNE